MHRFRRNVFLRTVAASMAVTGLLFTVGFAAWRLSRLSPAVTPPVSTVLPEESTPLTVLALGVDETDALAFSALIALLPQKGSIAVCALPPETLWQAEKSEGTLKAAYAAGGADYLRGRLGAWLGISIDRTLVQNYDGLAAVMATCGTLPYSLPNAVEGEWQGRTVTYPKGAYDLDTRALADLLVLPAPASPVARSDRAADLLMALLRHHLPAVLTESGEQLFQNLLNHSEGDLSIADYRAQEAVLQALAVQQDLVFLPVYLDGEAGQEGFRLSAPTLTCLRSTWE